MSILILQWRQPDRLLKLSWRGPDSAQMRDAIARGEAGSIAALIGPQGRDGNGDTTALEAEVAALKARVSALEAGGGSGAPIYSLDFSLSQNSGLVAAIGV